MLVRISVKKSNYEENIFYQINDNDCSVIKMVEIGPTGKMKWDESSADRPNLIEGEFPAKPLWSYTSDCFYTEISESDFNIIFEQAKKDGTRVKFI